MAILRYMRAVLLELLPVHASAATTGAAGPPGRPAAGHPHRGGQIRRGAGASTRR